MEHAGFVPSFVWVVPFLTLLIAIAVLPLVATHFWDSNTRKLIVSLVLGAPVVALYLRYAPAAVVHSATDYVSFMVLLGSLFVISGGVLLAGDLEATPAVNTLFLAIGAVVASIVGTTGASMLLIRPVLSTNSERTHVVHTVVFFIFLVSNIGGCLTPLGDPPLFLGYLQGVPFTWTFRLMPAWLVTTAVLLTVYFAWDTRAHSKEPPEYLQRDHTRVRPLKVYGGENLLLRAAGSELGVTEPWQYFWATGLLSSFLDNAPTYLTFLALGQGQGLANEVVGVPHTVLEAISLGAVFMGANSYIGNGPNFMVRSIAESRGVRMPSFGGYMLYSGAVLIPVFVAVTLVFF